MRWSLSSALGYLQVRQSRRGFRGQSWVSWVGSTVPFHFPGEECWAGLCSREGAGDLFNGCGISNLGDQRFWNLFPKDVNLLNATELHLKIAKWVNFMLCTNFATIKLKKKKKTQHNTTQQNLPGVNSLSQEKRKPLLIHTRSSASWVLQSACCFASQSSPLFHLLELTWGRTPHESSKLLLEGLRLSVSHH